MNRGTLYRVCAGVVLVALAGYGAIAGVGVVPFEAGPAPASGPGPESTPTDRPTPTDRTTPTDRATPSPPPAHEGYEQTTVTVLGGETGEELGAVEAAIADNRSLRITGLSETDDLPEDRGMLFTYGAEDNRTFVMRNMSFGIDIVFVASNGTITAIHEAPAPAPDEDGEDQRYPGTGRYVLEVNYGWTDERGVEVGDCVTFDLPE